MAGIKIEIPSTLGLSEEQAKGLRDKFANVIVETIRQGGEAERLAAKTKVVPEVVQSEVVVIVQ